MLTVSLKRKLLRYAKMKGPYDTGNLRHNAIQGKNWNDKNNFTIHYSEFDANYIEYLEEKTYAGGSSFKLNKHKGFISKTALDIATQLSTHFEYKTKMPKMLRMNNGEQLNTRQRSAVHKRSIDIYKLTREVK